MNIFLVTESAVLTFLGMGLWMFNAPPEQIGIAIFFNGILIGLAGLMEVRK